MKRLVLGLVMTLGLVGMVGGLWLVNRSQDTRGKAAENAVIYCGGEDYAGDQCPNGYSCVFQQSTLPDSGGVSGIRVCEAVSPTPTGNQCQTLWWFNENQVATAATGQYICQQRQFCGAYMYQGLRTFADGNACYAALSSITPTAVPTPACIWCGTSCTRNNPLADCSSATIPTGYSCSDVGGTCTKKCACPNGNACPQNDVGLCPESLPTATPTMTPEGSAKIDFKVTYNGVTTAAKCADKWKVKVTAMWSSGSETVTGVVLTPTEMAVGGWKVYSGEVSFKQAPKGEKLALFIKGPKHPQAKYGIDGQSDFYGKAGGEVMLGDDKTYDFTKYPMLAGDVNQDGVVDGQDFSIVKTEAAKRSTGDDLTADLNGNCAMESQDVAMLMLTLENKQEQLY